MAVANIEKATGVGGKCHKVFLASESHIPFLMIVRRDYFQPRVFYHYNVAHVTATLAEADKRMYPMIYDELTPTPEDGVVSILFNPPKENWRHPPNNGNRNDGVVRIRVESKLLQRLHSVCGYNLTVNVVGSVYRNTFRNGRRYQLLLNNEILSLPVNDDGTTSEKIINMVPGLFGLSTLSATFTVWLEWNGPGPFLCGAVSTYEQLRWSEEPDFKIVLQNKSYWCHSRVLSVLSPVFKAMLSTCMSERKNGQLYLKDFDDCSIEAFLRYAYEGRIHEAYMNSTICFKLFCFGHQYEIVELENAMRELFEGKALNWFSTEAALNLYCFAGSLHNGDWLMEKSWQVLQNRRTEVSRLEDFEKLSRMFPGLKDLFQEPYDIREM